MSSTSSGSQDIARQTLTDRLLDAVKQCQIRFGGKTELATDNDSRVSCLCAQWETVLQFGLKSNKKLNPLRHVAGQVLLRPEGESAWWQFIKGHLSSTEIRRFNSLTNVTTDVGRAHAWLRSALNEQSLEKYLHNFLSNHQMLSLYFEKEALLLDEERSTMLPMMAAGLSSILFAINIDNAEFNNSKQPSTLSSSNNHLAAVPEAWQAPSPVYSAVAPAKEKKKRKKKKTNVAIASIENIDFEEDDNGDRFESEDETRKEIGKDLSKIWGENTQPLIGVASETQIESDSSRLSYDRESDNLPKKVTNEPVSSKLSPNIDMVSQANNDEPLVEMSSGVSLTPVDFPDDEATLWSTPGLLRPTGKESPAFSDVTTDDDVSEDANLAIDATEAALSAAQDVHREMAGFSRSSLVRTMGDGRTSPPTDSGNTKEMTSGELKQAIVSMMLRKDEVEECNR